MVVDAAQDPSPEPDPGPGRGLFATGERLVQSKGWVLALALVALGLALRLNEKLGYWINPDEGINYSIISQPTLAGCWGELVHNTHPPLTSVVMWTMSLLSADHVWLRMASLVSGCLAIFAAYLAGRELGGKRDAVCGLSGLVAAALVAVSPFAIDQSQLIRPYMLQFALLTFAIWFLARWLRKTFAIVPSAAADGARNVPPELPRGLGGFAICASLAIFAQFSSFLVVDALGIVLALLLLSHRLPRAAVRPLAIAFIAPVATMGLLFVVHIGPYLLGSSIQETAKSSWLSTTMGSGLGQLWFNVVGLHVYLFGAYFAGGAVVITILAILFGLLRGRTAALFAVTLLALSMLASLADYYPFGGSRHSGYLLLVLALAVADAASLLGTMGPLALGIGGVLVGALLAFGGALTNALAASTEQLSRPREVILSGDNWKRAAHSLDEVITTDAVVFMNLQSYYCLFPEIRKHWDVASRRFLTADSGVLIGRSFRMGQATVLVNEDWEMTIRPGRIAESAHLFRFVVQASEQNPQLRLRDRRKVWLVFAGWMSESILQLKLNADKLRAESGLQMIHRWKEYPGFVLCQLDLAVFMTVFGQFDRDK